MKYRNSVFYTVFLQPKVLSFLRKELKTRNLSLEATVEFTTDADEEEFTVKVEKVMVSAE